MTQKSDSHNIDDLRHSFMGRANQKTLILTLLIALHVHCTGCGHGDSHVILQDVGYSRFTKELGTHYIDPKDATHIWIEFTGSMDSDCFWYKCNISPKGYRELLTKWETKQAGPKTTSFNVEELFAAAPHWWRSDVAGCEWTYHLDVSTSDNPGAAADAWGYCKSTNTLFIWKAYRQHAKTAKDLMVGKSKGERH